MNKMTLIYVKGEAKVAPGNVLAGLSQTAVSTESPPAAATDQEKRDLELKKVGDLLGVAMVVRSVSDATTGAPPFGFNNVEFKVPFDNFGLFTDDVDPDVLKNPRAYYVDETEKKAKALPGILVAASFPDIDVTVAGVKVKLGADVSVDTGVWVLIADSSGLPKGQARSGVITKDATDKKNLMLNGPLPSGTYLVLTLVTGYQPAVFSRTVP